MPRPSRSRIKLSDEEKKKRRREQKKMSMRRARAKLDEAALEERRRKDRERYHRKKQDGLIKTINDFTPRQQRQIRKMWREKSKLRREKEKIRKRTEIILNDTPPSSPSSSFSRIASGRAVSARNRRRLKAKNEYLSLRLQILEKKLAKYRMRILRLKRKREKKQSDRVSIKEKIHEFLLDDENSRLTSGKKDTITRRKVKKQIRLLNDTLLNLHRTFINKTGLNISYETFRRHRPFWVISPTAASRNTCLCSTCTNNNYIVCALHRAKIIRYSKASALAKSLCCNNEPNVACLERRCAQCCEKKVDFNIINGRDTIIYERWVTKTVEVTIKGQTKIVKKTIKEKVKTSQLLLTNILKSNLPTYMQHLANYYNQVRAINFIKQNLTASDGLLHIDFSENYGCKYGAEIQSAHFGGSKEQLSLHTCVFYSKDSQKSQGTIKSSCFCTVSQDLRHDPVLICAHLKPVIEQIKLEIPRLKVLHILSDGPTTQYRNKTMFQMIVNYISQISSAETIAWHFSESGHGKGAPDGVGGCLKRTCDKAVGNGKDIIDLNTFIDCTKVNCKGITVMPIDDSVVSDIQKIADALTVPPFKGTFKIHQITWTTREPNILHVRRLSCIVCAADTKCPHFEMGLIPVQTVQLLGTSQSSTSEAVMPNPVALSPGTASASTVTGPRTPELTPSPEPILNIRQPLAPKKRLYVEDIYSDDSVCVTPDKIFKPAIFDDSDGEISPLYNRSNPRLGLFHDRDADGESVSPQKSKKRLAFFDDSDEENLPPKISKKRPASTSDETDEDIF